MIIRDIHSLETNLFVPHYIVSIKCIAFVYTLF